MNAQEIESSNRIGTSVFGDFIQKFYNYLTIPLATIFVRLSGCLQLQFYLSTYAESLACLAKFRFM